MTSFTTDSSATEQVTPETEQSAADRIILRAARSMQKADAVERGLMEEGHRVRYDAMTLPRYIEIATHLYSDNLLAR